MATVPITQTIMEIVDTVCEQHGLAPIGDTHKSLADQGITSMAMVDLMMAIEARFDLEIPRSELNAGNFKDVEAIASMMARLRSTLAA